MNILHHSSPSDRHVRLMWLAGTVLVFLCIAACGKKGPLYLPDDAGASAKSSGEVMMPAPVPPPK